MMKRETSRVPESRVCEIVGIKQQRRRALVKKGLLDPTGKGGSTIQETMELATLVRLLQALSPTEAGVAWNSLRPMLRETIPGTRFDVVYDKQLGSIQVVRGDEELRQAVIHGRPVQVIELGSRLVEVADAFRRWADGQSPRPRGQRKSNAETA
jgi:hypothetical protein